jgi:dihydrofolate reductase
MSKVFLNISMSLDGFVAGPKEGGPDRELEAMDRLHKWMFSGKTEQDAVQALETFWQPIGAVVMGRRVFDLGEKPWVDNPIFHAPCFVLTHRPHDHIVKQGGTSYTFVTDGVHSAVAQARSAAGNRDVVVNGGANATQELLKAGLLDELHIHLAPVLLKRGIRLFDHLGDEHIQLEAMEAVHTPTVTHLRYRVVK